MDFYEELKKRALTQIRKSHGTLIRTDGNDGVLATIEAMKEMMVGKPITGRIEDILTTLDLFGPGLLRREELTIIVFRGGIEWTKDNR